MNRVATAGELSASIAHEVNQPITGMVLKAGAALRLLPEGLPNAQKIRDLLTDIASAGQRAGEVVAGVRAMFKKDTNEKIPIDINRLVLRVLEIVRIERTRNGVEVQTDLADDLPDVLGDNVQLQQVVLNLVMNAIEAMQSAQSRILQIRSWKSGPGTVHVSVEDSGTGIGASDLGRIFNPLFTTKAAGMGMGLSICRSIIESHGGRIWVAAAVGRGAIFQFELPTAESLTASRDLAA